MDFRLPVISDCSPPLLSNKAAHKDIDELKLAGCKRAFYGDQEVPAASQLQENRSDPTVNEDLNGYYEIYRDTPALEFLDAFAKSEFKELSPAHVSGAILFYSILSNTHLTLILVSVLVGVSD